jgi:GntR family transcriptional regulator/MocR family aminotransferase
MIYVTPSHQYPTGVAMSLPRRMELLNFAAANRSLIIEDDYDSEFHYSSRPLAALQGIDRAGCVAYVGTFSKVLAPGLRVAYAVVPPSLLTPVRAILRQEGGSVPIHVQAALADFLNVGHLRSHIRRMHDIYRERMQAVRTVLLDVGGDMFDVGPENDGLQIAAWFRDPNADDGEAAARFHAMNIGVRALSPLHMMQPRPGLLFGIATATDDQVARLGNALRTLVGGRP